jgi:D-alanine-D-alanine ligase
MAYIGCNQLASSITFNKWTCNTLLKAGGFNVARSIVLRSNKEHFNPLDFYNEIGLPMFIKPNNGGSSFGVSKVKTINEIGKAIDDAFKEGSEVIIESAIEGKEYTCGVYKHKKEIKALPITEIISDSEFFDYAAKYEGKSKEITPARLDETTTVKLQYMCCEAYKYLHLGGFVRIDFMYNGNEAFIIEINTVPGMSEQSIIPQQVRANGMDLTEFITAFIDELFDQ